MFKSNMFENMMVSRLKRPVPDDGWVATERACSHKVACEPGKFLRQKEPGSKPLMHCCMDGFLFVTRDLENVSDTNGD